MLKPTAKKNLFDELGKEGFNFDENQMKKIVDKINTITSYQPKVGIFGKTGVGKSSLSNALFGADVCQISDISACTRKAQEILLSLSDDNGLILVDVPGVGESSKRDSEYSELYKNLLPELDIVLWLLKADDRAFTSDEMFYTNVVKPHLIKGKPFFFVLNQIDKIEPYREWDVNGCKPGSKQLTNINSKINEVAKYFDVAKSKVIPVSANEKYNLINLVDEIVFSLPPEKLVTFVEHVDKNLISEKTKGHVKSSVIGYILQGAATGAKIGSKYGPIGTVIGAAIGGVAGWLFGD